MKLKRRLCIAAYFVGSLYSPVELSRYILQYQKTFGQAICFKYELLYIWFAYAVATTFFLLLLWTKWEDIP